MRRAEPHESGQFEERMARQTVPDAERRAVETGPELVGVEIEERPARAAHGGVVRRTQARGAGTRRAGSARAAWRSTTRAGTPPRTAKRMSS